MKFKYLIMWFLALVVFTGCEEDHRNDNLYDSAVYFVNNATAGVLSTDLFYDVQDVVEHPVYVYLSGFYGGTTKVSMAVDESFIETYNTTNYTSYKPLPASCYTITTSSSEVVDRKARMSVEFNIPALLELSTAEDYSDLSEYVVPLVLKSNGEIPVSERSNGWLGYELITPNLNPAMMYVSGELDANDSNVMTVTVSMPFENAWNAEYELDFGGTAAMTEEVIGDAVGNSIPARFVLTPLPDGTTIEGAEIVTMEPGVNTVTYRVTIPAQETMGIETFGFNIKNATLNGKSVPVSCTAYLRRTKDIAQGVLLDKSDTSHDAEYLGKGLEAYGLTLHDDSSYSFVPESAASDGMGVRVFDNNTTNIWENRYGSGGYGTLSIPFLSVTDMKSVKNVNAIEVWRRNHSTYVTDLRKFEVYAADVCDYVTNKESFDCSGMTYLGVVDFGGKENEARVLYQMIDNIDTQYLVFKYTGSNRNGSCISISELNIWGN